VQEAVADESSQADLGFLALALDQRPFTLELRVRELQRTTESHTAILKEDVGKELA